MNWRRINMGGVIFCVALWAVAAFTGLIGSTVFIGHVSMLALVGSFLSAWRSDVPIPDDN